MAEQNVVVVRAMSRATPTEPECPEEGQMPGRPDRPSLRAPHRAPQERRGAPDEAVSARRRSADWTSSASRPCSASSRLGAGAMMGMAFDIDQVETADEALVVLGRAIPPESTAVIASVKEPAVEVIDGEMKKLDGEVTRRPVAEVMDELEVAEAAADAAAREARRALHEKRKAELTAGVDERVGKLKEKLHVSWTTRRCLPASLGARACWLARRRRMVRTARTPLQAPCRGRSAGVAGRDPAERAGSDDELERWVRSIASPSTCARPARGGQLESHGGPGPSRAWPARGVSRTTTPSCPLSSDLAGCRVHAGVRASRVVRRARPRSCDAGGLVVHELQLSCRRARSEDFRRRLQQRRRLGVAVRRLSNRVAVDPERDVVEERGGRSPPPRRSGVRRRR